MKSPFVRLWALALFALALASCGGNDGGDGGGTTPPPPSASIKDKINAAAADPANDSSTNSSSAFAVLQNAGVPAVVVSSPPKVNFTVFSNGAVLKSLTTSNVSFIIAKLVPGTDGNPDKWESYTYRVETAAPGVGPGGNPVLESAVQATTDSKTATQLVYKDDGYYTYTFSKDITDPTQTNGVVFEPGRTHRIAIQLSYPNPNDDPNISGDETVRVNPYFDVTFDSNGNSVAVTDPSKTRKVTDVSSCNGCHEKLALHGGGRVDTQYCVMCHNPGTTDANSGNVLTLSTMAHKIHAGRLIANAAGGEHYVIWGYQNSKHDYAEVGFPQDLRNCTKCHSADNPNTPQGDLWKSAVSKEACLTCHANNAGSAWDDTHKIYAGSSSGKDLTNAQCKQCHITGGNLGPDVVHWNQNEENAAKYKMVIESAAYDAASRNVTVKYYLADPTNSNAKYNLLTTGCTGSGTSASCPNTEKFANLRFYVAYQALVGQPTAVTEFSSYNNGGNGANQYAYKGTNDGSNNYTVEITLPADTATSVAAGTARVVTIGQIKEPLLVAKSAANPRPEVVPQVLINTLAQNTYKDVVLTGTMNPRREIVSNEKCNVCHGALGATSGSNTLANAFHSGARNTVEACALCHDANRSSSTVMTSGLQLQESYQFKRMIHGIHGNSKRTYPFQHGNRVWGEWSKDGILLTEGLNTRNTPPTPVPAGSTWLDDVENYAAEVAWPGVGINCNACHVNNSYKQDRGPLGAVISTRPTGSNPQTWQVISPKAASCTACHDSAYALGHVTSFGGASFGNATIGDLWTKPRETCDDCHASGGFKAVDYVHNQK